MSSTQLAEMLSYLVKETNKKIRAMFGEDKAREIFSPTLRPNGQVLEYHLPEKESKMFVARHDINYLEQVIQFWIDKDSEQVKLPENFSEALRLAADLQEKNENNSTKLNTKIS